MLKDHNSTARKLDAVDMLNWHSGPVECLLCDGRLWVKSLTKDFRNGTSCGSMWCSALRKDG